MKMGVAEQAAPIFLLGYPDLVARKPHSLLYFLGGTLSPTVVFFSRANNKGRGKMNWYLEVLKKYAVFNGRARRKEYWYFFLFNFIISVVLAVIDNMTGSFSADAGIGLLGAIYALAVLVPGLAVSVRRLHDTGRSGWWLLIILLPLIGVIVLLVFMLLEGKPDTNQYGPNPKGAIA